MNGPLDAENLTIGITDEGTPTLLPKPIYWLQQEGFNIDGVTEAHTVKSDGSDTAHIVFKVQTYDYRRTDPRLDAVDHTIDLWVCDCWAYRSGFPNLQEDFRPSDAVMCKHVSRIDKVERAKNDENQETL